MSNSRQFIQRRSGFTIVEMLLYMGILTLFFTVLTQISLSILNVQLESESTREVEDDSRAVYTRLAYDVSQADAIVTPSNVGENSTTLTLSVAGVPHIYAVVNGNLIARVGDQTYMVNSVGTSITDFTALRLGNTQGKHAVTIHYKLTSATKQSGGPEMRESQVTLGIR